MVSLEDRINELCKGSMLMSPIWLARLVEEIFDAAWIKRQGTVVSTTPDNNNWPLVVAANLPNQLASTSWSAVGRSKTETPTIVRFLSPQGALFTALRQSADAWVSVAFDAKLAQSDSVRIATGVATIMRQPKLASSDMNYRPQSRSFDFQSPQSDQNCMITLPVPHYFILRLIAYLVIPDVIEVLNKSDGASTYSSLTSIAGQKPGTFPVPACIYSDLVDEYCEYLLTNARQPPGTTLVTSRSLCADLARLYVQSVADFWLAPYASPMDSSSLSFASVTLPPTVLLHFVRRFLKRYFCHVADEWCGPNTSAIRQTTFTSLKQPLLAFILSCATHWPLNTSFGYVISCWRAVALPWRAAKTMNQSNNAQPLQIWDSFVSENIAYYSETLLVPMLMHLTRANIACPAYAAALNRLAKVFGGSPDAEALQKLLVRLSTTSSNHHNSWNSSAAVMTPNVLHARNVQTQFCFASYPVVSAVKQLTGIIDTALTSCPASTKDLLRNAKNLLNNAFLSGGLDETGGLNDTMNRTPSFCAPSADRNKESGGRIPKFRRLPERQQSFSSFARGEQKPGEPDFRSTDIPIILRIQYLLASFVKSHGLVPKGGRARTILQNARFRWMADRRELGLLAVFLLLSYFMCSSPAFYFLGMLYITVRTFLTAMVSNIQDLVQGKGQNDFNNEGTRVSHEHTD